MSGFITPPAPPQCDIILTQEEYELVMRHRAMKRWLARQAQRETAQTRPLPHTPALKRLLELDR